MLTFREVIQAVVRNGGTPGLNRGGQGDGRLPAHLHARNRTRRIPPHDAVAPRPLPAGDGPAHADRRDLVLRRGPGRRRFAGFREQDAQGLHPRLAGRGDGRGEGGSVSSSFPFRGKAGMGVNFGVHASARAKPQAGHQQRFDAAAFAALRLPCAARSPGPSHNSLRSLRSLRSNTCAESDDEARQMRARPEALR